LDIKKRQYSTTYIENTISLTSFSGFRDLAKRESVYESAIELIEVPSEDK
jgi:hypothetical protein